MVIQPTTCKRQSVFAAVLTSGSIKDRLNDGSRAVFEMSADRWLRKESANLDWEFSLDQLTKATEEGISNDKRMLLESIQVYLPNIEFAH